MSYSTLIKSLDRIFSQYIRQRDSDNGYGKCISCGKVVHWKKAHAGHYINRKHLSVRFNECNVNLQCVSCNTFDEGNPVGYAIGLIKKYGDNILNELMAAKSRKVKWTQTELKEFIKYYQTLINQ